MRDLKSLKKLLRVLIRCFEELTKSKSGKMFDVLRILIRGLKWNINIKKLVNNLSWQDLWIILNADTINNVPPNLINVWNEIDSLATDAAYNYAAINLTFRYHSVFEKLLPHTLREQFTQNRGKLPSRGWEMYIHGMELALSVIPNCIPKV